MKKLTIIGGSTVDIDLPVKSDSCDFLALSLPTMVYLEEKGIPFKTLEDFYQKQTCNREWQDFSKALQSVLEKCDDLYNDVVGFPRCFSGNGFWFLHRLANLYYIQKVATAIKNQYESVDIVTDCFIGTPSDLGVNVKTLDLRAFGIGLKYVLMHLSVSLSDCIENQNIQSAKTDVKNRLKEPFWSYVKRSPEIIWRRGGQLLKNMVRCFHIKKGELLIVQGNYDVEIVRMSCPGFHFRPVLNDLYEHLVLASNKVYENPNKHALGIMKGFFKDFFPDFHQWLENLIKSYQAEVIGRLHYAIKHANLLLDKPGILGVLYSIGSENIVEDVIAHCSNIKHIPVYYFKHGGIETQFLKPSIFDRYMEKNPNIGRVQFIHSDFEQLEFKELDKVTAIRVGNLERKTKIGKTRKRYKSRILYSVGPPAHYTFKEMRRIISDHERFTFVKNLVQVSSHLNVGLDVKVHPAEWQVGQAFFKKIQKFYQTSPKQLNLITGGSIERIIDHYGLVVFDMIPTKVLSTAFVLNIPIILYLPEGFEVNEKTFPDLMNRVYIVRNQEQLENVISRFKSKDLASKWSEEFIKKYLGPLDINESLKIVFQTLTESRE